MGSNPTPSATSVQSWALRPVLFPPRLRRRAEMIAAVAAAWQAHSLACGLREPGEHRRGDRLLACTFQHRRCAVRIDARLVADGLEATDAVPQIGIVQIGNAAFNRVIKALEPQVSFCRSWPRRTWLNGSGRSATWGRRQPAAALPWGCGSSCEPGRRRTPPVFNRWDRDGNDLFGLLSPVLMRRLISCWPT